MSAFYRIRDWDKLYENGETRKRKFLHWVPVPNRFDGSGYSQLVSHPDGAAHFGAWCAMLEVASRSELRGYLLRTSGMPHTPETLAYATRLPASVFTAAIERLLEIGWIESIGNLPESADVSANSSTEQNSNRTE